jgi:hypothetical protein
VDLVLIQNLNSVIDAICAYAEVRKREPHREAYVANASEPSLEIRQQSNEQLLQLGKPIPWWPPQGWDGTTIEHSTSSKDKEYWNDELDGFYDVVDQKTGQIAFRKNHPRYEMLRSAMLGLGQSIEDITTEDQLCEFESTHQQYLLDIITARLLAKPAETLSQKAIKALILGDDEQFERILSLLEKRKRMGLRVV